MRTKKENQSEHYSLERIEGMNQPVCTFYMNGKKWRERENNNDDDQA